MDRPTEPWRVALEQSTRPPLVKQSKAEIEAQAEASTPIK